jgi:hypothetical protein
MRPWGGAALTFGEQTKEEMQTKAKRRMRTGIRTRKARGVAANVDRSLRNYLRA